MIASLCKLGRAETAALVVETLAAHGIEVVLVGGSCACVWTNERFGSFDLDFIDLTYKRRKQITVALADIGFAPKGATKYFEHPLSQHRRRVHCQCLNADSGKDRTFVNAQLSRDLRPLAAMLLEQAY